MLPTNLVNGVVGIAAMEGLSFSSNDKTVLGAVVCMQPRPVKNAWCESSVKDGGFINGISVKYKLEKKAKAPEDVVLKMLVGQWVAKYIVIDTVKINDPQVETNLVAKPL